MSKQCNPLDPAALAKAKVLGCLLASSQKKTISVLPWQTWALCLTKRQIESNSHLTAAPKPNIPSKINKMLIGFQCPGSYMGYSASCINAHPPQNRGSDNRLVTPAAKKGRCYIGLFSSGSHLGPNKASMPHSTQPLDLAHSST